MCKNQKQNQLCGVCLVPHMCEMTDPASIHGLLQMVLCKHWCEHECLCVHTSCINKILRTTLTYGTRNYSLTHKVSLDHCHALLYGISHMGRWEVHWDSEDWTPLADQQDIPITKGQKQYIMNTNSNHMINQNQLHKFTLLLWRIFTLFKKIGSATSCSI